MEPNINSSGEFDSLSEYSSYLVMNFIKPFFAISEGITLKALMALFASMFVAPPDLIMLVAFFWMADLFSGVGRAFVDKKPFIPVKVLPWLIKGIVYFIGLSLVSAFANVMGNYFDWAKYIQYTVFGVVAFTDMWSNIRHLLGPKYAENAIVLAFKGVLSGKSAQELIKEQMDREEKE